MHAFRGVIPNESRFLRGESIGELFDRVIPALERLVADDGWHTALAVLHGGVNRAILSYALTGERMFLGHFEQAPACVNVLDLGDGGEWIVRAVNVAAYDLLHLSHRSTTMERYWEQYRAENELEAGFPAPSPSHTQERRYRGRPSISLPWSCQSGCVYRIELHLADDEAGPSWTSSDGRPGARTGSRCSSSGAPPGSSRGSGSSPRPCRAWTNASAFATP